MSLHYYVASGPLDDIDDGFDVGVAFRCHGINPNRHSKSRITTNTIPPPTDVA